MEVLGWKRLELNSVPKFANVTESAFNSLLRRGLVIYYKAQFKDPSWLKRNMPDHDARGVFARDPSRRQFLRSAPSVAATLTILRGFWYSYSATDAMDIIEEYADGGGDAGITRVPASSVWFRL